MNATAEHAHGQFSAVGESGRTRRFAAGGLWFEGAGGAAAGVLAIIALAGILPIGLMPIAVIGIGVSLVFEGGAVGARFSRLLAASGERAAGHTELSGGVTAEFMAGAAGIVMGVLALVGIAPLELSSAAVVLYGGALLLGSGIMSRLHYFEITSGQTNENVLQLARDAVAVSAGAQILAGLGAATLGILALAGINPMNLTLTGLLSLGVAILLSGRVAGDRIGSFLS